MADGRPSTDVLIKLPNGGGATFGDEGPQPPLEGELNDFPILEELEEERAYVVDGLRPAQVEEDDPRGTLGGPFSGGHGIRRPLG